MVQLALPKQSYTLSRATKIVLMFLSESENGREEFELPQY